MLSRVACNIYWMARYLERAENTARLVNVHGHLLLDLPRRTRTFGWEPLLAITGSDELFFQHYRAANETNVVKFLLSDAENPSSILSSLKQARENLRTTRDIIPREGWEEVNDLYLSVKTRLADGVSRRARYDFLKSIVRQIQLVTGLFHGTMSHDTGYNFMRIGSYLERADMTSRIVDVRSANLLSGDPDAELELTPLENIQWMSVLKSMTAYQMYRQHVRLQVQGADVLNFLLRDKEFPRSYLYCLARAGFCLKGLPRNHAPLRRIGQLQRLVEQADVKALAQTGLHEFIDSLQASLAGIHDSIDSIYFSAEPAKPKPKSGQSQSQSQAA